MKLHGLLDIQLTLLLYNFLVHELGPNLSFRMAICLVSKHFEFGGNNYFHIKTISKNRKAQEGSSPSGWDILTAVRTLMAQVPCLGSKLRVRGAFGHALPNSTR